MMILKKMVLIILTDDGFWKTIAIDYFNGWWFWKKLLLIILTDDGFGKKLLLIILTDDDFEKNGYWLF